MPEGDTIFRAARTLHRALAGHMVTRFESVLPHLTRVHEDTPITGRTMDRVDARGKHLLMHFSGDLILRTHMRMSGSWHIYRTGERWQRPSGDMRIIVATDTFVAVAFKVPVAVFESTHTIERDESLGSLGPDLLAPHLEELGILQRMRLPLVDVQPINEVLLNQRVMAGVGNVFKSETLFVTGINPFTLVNELPDDKLSLLVTTARRLLLANVTDHSRDGIVTYFGFRRTTRRSNPLDRLWVYGRGGAPCRVCAAPIQYRKTGIDARGTYWCPHCQPASAPVATDAG
jgi:endonuclease VIII